MENCSVQLSWSTSCNDMQKGPEMPEVSYQPCWSTHASTHPYLAKEPELGIQLTTSSTSTNAKCCDSKNAEC